MPPDHEHFMRLALEEAARGGAEGNNAVGSVIARGNEVVARGRNLVASTFDPTAHAEIVALREASAALGCVDFSGYTLYTTIEPCPMCCGAIMTSGVTTLVVGASHRLVGITRWGPYTVERLLDMANWRKTTQLVTEVLPNECAEMRLKWQAVNMARPQARST